MIDAATLQYLYQLGETLVEALESDDLPLYFDALEERGTLLDSLSKQHTPPSTPSEEARRMAPALADQHRRLTAALQQQEQRLGKALSEIDRYKDAHSGYTSPPPAAGSILRGGLSG